MISWNQVCDDKLYNFQPIFIKNINQAKIIILDSFVSLIIEENSANYDLISTYIIIIVKYHLSTMMPQNQLIGFILQMSELCLLKM